MPTNLIQNIDAWWAEFTARANDISDLFAQRKKWDLPGWMQEHLQGINEHLMWEFGRRFGEGGTGS